MSEQVKLAFVTEDGRSISAHFGRAPKVLVITLEDGQEIARELRDKEAHGSHDHGHSHEHDHDHHRRDHTSKFTAMTDCQVMVVRGIGSPAVAHAESLGLTVYLTREPSIDAALAAYLAGTLDHNAGSIHVH